MLDSSLLKYSDPAWSVTEKASHDEEDGQDEMLGTNEGVERRAVEDEEFEAYHS